MTKKITYLLVLIVAATFTNVTNAQTQTTIHMDAIPLQITDWTNNVAFPQFDPALGTLESICFELIGGVEGEAQLESRDAEPQTLTANLAATITLSDTNGNMLLTVVPVASTTFNATAFDGVTDFGGTSGFSTGTVSNTAPTATAFLTAAADLALFTGTGTISLPITADGASDFTGAGNAASIFDSRAEASVNVSYKFAPVPEGSAGMSFALGMASLLIMRRRRKS